MKASPEQLEKLGQQAALLVQTHQRVGLGSGKAAQAFVRALALRVQREGLVIQTTSTSVVTEKLARECGLTPLPLSELTELDLVIDGADEVDPALNLIKGGGGHLLREKILASLAPRLIILVGQEKLVEQLGVSFPIFLEVVEFGIPAIRKHLAKLGGQAPLRLNDQGHPFITENGNPILNARFGPAPHGLSDAQSLDQALHQIPGIIETGLFIGRATELLVAFADGHIEHRQR